MLLLVFLYIRLNILIINEDFIVIHEGLSFLVKEDFLFSCVHEYTAYLIKTVETYVTIADTVGAIIVLEDD